MDSDLTCWKCGASLADVPMPFARAAECAACRADLHVCVMCTFYAPSVANACREPIAEPVAEKRRANFCGYFTPRAGAHRPDVAAESAKAQLDALFGAPSAAASPNDGASAKSALDELFGLKPENP